MSSVLDDRFALEELLDPGVLTEVCEAYVTCFDLGVRLINDRGVEQLNLRPNLSFCKFIAAAKSGERCREVERKLIKHPLEGNQAVQLKSSCGLHYALIPLNYQLELLGRVVVGPFRDPQESPDIILQRLTEPPPFLKKEDVLKVPAPTPEQLTKTLGLFSKTINAFLFINAKRLITTRLHLEAIYSSREQIFQQVENQDAGQKEDRDEIEKLKHLF